MPKKKEHQDPNTNIASTNFRKSLIDRYKTIFIDRLTKKDLEELQFYLKHQFDENRHINQEYKIKFEWKLRHFFDEEVLNREIFSIETLIQHLKPEDLKKIE